jgi:hypothetical protein
MGVSAPASQCSHVSKAQVDILSIDFTLKAGHLLTMPVNSSANFKFIMKIVNLDIKSTTTGAIYS